MSRYPPSLFSVTYKWIKHDPIFRAELPAKIETGEKGAQTLASIANAKIHLYNENPHIYKGVFVNVNLAIEKPIDLAQTIKKLSGV